MNRGDPYPAEVAATVGLIMGQLGWSNPYRSDIFHLKLILIV